MSIYLMPVAACSVCLPHLNECTADWPPMLIQHAPMNEDSFAKGLALVLRRQIVVVLADQTVPKNRAGSFCQRFREEELRHSWRPRN